MLVHNLRPSILRMSTFDDHYTFHAVSKTEKTPIVVYALDHLGR